MAFVNLAPGSWNPTIVPTLAQAWTLPVINSLAGTPVDFSAWTSLTAHLYPPSNNPTGSAVAFGTVTGATGGLITVATNATDLATVPSGTSRVYISGKPTSGDIVQLIAGGAAAINTLNT